MSPFPRPCRPRPAPVAARLLAVTLAATLVYAPASHADRTDADQPVALEADRVTVDDAKKVHVFDGNVLLTQGTLTIRAQRLIVSQDGQGFQKGVATGAPARFRQKREGRDDYVEGEAERIEHDNRRERTEFFGQARIKSGLDEVRGNYISYDARTEQYTANAAPGAAPRADGSGRVRAVIQPKQKPADPTGTAAAPDRRN